MSRARAPRNEEDGTPKDESTNPRAPLLNGDMASTILLQIKDSIPRIETELKHLKEMAQATKKDVEDLKTWKTLILGAAGLLAVLFGLYKAVSGSVHVTFGDAPPSVSTPQVQAPAASPAAAAPAPKIP